MWFRFPYKQGIIEIEQVHSTILSRPFWSGQYYDRHGITRFGSIGDSALLCMKRLREKITKGVN